MMPVSNEKRGPRVRPGSPGKGFSPPDGGAFDAAD